MTGFGLLKNKRKMSFFFFEKKRDEFGIKYLKYKGFVFGFGKFFFFFLGPKVNLLPFPSHST